MADLMGDLQVPEPQETELVDLTDEPDEPVEAFKDGNGSCFEDLVLPTATIVKIIKDVLPDNSIIAKEAKEMARRVATYFILYVTDCATEIASGKKRKTILPADIISALKELDFDDMVETLNGLLKYRKSKGSISKKNGATPVETVDAVSDDIDAAIGHLDKEMAKCDEIAIGSSVALAIEKIFSDQIAVGEAQSPAPPLSCLDRAFNASDDDE